MKLQELAIKAIKEVQENIKKLVNNKKKGEFYSKLPSDTELNPLVVRKAAEIKSQISVLESQLKALQDEYDPLRKEILENLPGDAKDKVEVVVNGVQIKKFAQIRGGGKIDEKRLMELAKKKRILQKVTKKVRVIDEDAVLLALANGDLTYDEYEECITEGKVVQQLQLEKKFEVEDEDQKVV